jgi:hypothetical protein
MFRLKENSAQHVKKAIFPIFCTKKRILEKIMRKKETERRISSLSTEKEKI